LQPRFPAFPASRSIYISNCRSRILPPPRRSRQPGRDAREKPPLSELFYDLPHTSHDVHRVQHDPGTFSKLCFSCHKPETAMFPKQNHQATSNCLDCRMPLQETNLIVFDQNGKRARSKYEITGLTCTPKARRILLKVTKDASRSAVPASDESAHCIATITQYTPVGCLSLRA
jgi:hypothetical protein